ncbi:spermidine synthase isoform X1 [Trachemys scripta elegans]|uniref:spermidine synthase isoform X1 n=1 Tax=Trachemys scripta elegans TaxID=31138 RepID=UPI001553B0F1|nr:spermidine synthase isoform X1 [Trachemys scripta elegans]
MPGRGPVLVGAGRWLPAPGGHGVGAGVIPDTSPKHQSGACPTLSGGRRQRRSGARPGATSLFSADAVLRPLRFSCLRSKTYGNVLVLDGVIQCTERDEFSYQETIANLPLCSHPKPRKVLIIGGGDGGVLREVVKHPSVDSVVQCEIDEDVIQVSKKYLPGMAVGYSSPKLTLHVGDGFEFMKQNQEAFDVIITDSSDPMGPAESLFKESYYQLMKTALREDGILCCQGECQWLHLDLIKEMRQFCKSLFPVVEYAYCTIPTYPSGQIGFMLCSKNPSTNFREPVQQLSQQQVEKMNLKYYNSDIHQAAFILPEFARKALSDV